MNAEALSQSQASWRGPPLQIGRPSSCLRHGVVSLAAGLLWPYLSRIGLGRLPGDLVIEREDMKFYFPVMTCLVLSALLSLVFWVLNR